MTEITTAARRITRTINATKSFYRVWFDQDGTEVGSQPADTHLAAPEGAVVSLIGRKGDPATQAEVQRLIDEATDRRTESVRDRIHRERLTETAREIADLERQLAERVAYRDDAIRDAIRAGYPVMEIVADTGLTRGRVYQIARA